jgi:hypothetical protein
MSRSEKCRAVMKRRWAGRDEYWRELITRQQESGQSITAFCAGEGVHPSSFHAWRRKLGLLPAAAASAKPQRSDFVEITVTPTGAAGIGIEFPGGVVVRPRIGFDADELCRVLVAVQKVCGG